MTVLDASGLAQLIHPLIGLPAWGANLGVGSMVTAEFGEPEPGDDGIVHGQWHLWITMAAWRWETTDAVIAGSEDDRSKLADVIPALNGDVLTGITVTPPSYETTFHFSRSKLIAFPIYSRSLDTGSLGNWNLWTPDGSVITSDTERGLLVEPRSSQP